MINGIKPVIGNTTKTEKTTTKNGLSFDEAMDTLLVKIQEDYDKWGSRSGIDKKMDLISRQNSLISYIGGLSTAVGSTDRILLNKLRKGIGGGGGRKR